MIILLQTIDANQHKRYFSWWFSRLELAFEVMNAIRSTGSRLITAELIDNDQQTQLPVHAFDGNAIPYSAKIQQLECEWHQLLNVSMKK